MSESENIEGVEQEVKIENNVKKRSRHRKRLLYEKLLKQMEFYFSNANLCKDRFLGQLIKSDPYVPLETFLKFNKIRALTHEVNDIAKAIKHSTILQLSDDKQKVKRKIEMQPYDADARTVYVESIPVTADREWLSKIFSEYGCVVYISLPKYKNSHRIKGYAFIEFDKPEEAQKCLNTFIKMGCKLPTSTAPDDLTSIKTFSIDDAHDDGNEDKEEYEPPKKKNRKSKEKKLNKSMELKLKQEISSDKKLVTPSEEQKDLNISTEEGKTTDAESKDEATSQDESGKEKGAKRKKKAKKKSAKEKNKAKTDELNGALWGLQVLSKAEWKALRNKYLNLQRKHMKELKTQLRNKRFAYSIPEPAEATEAQVPNTQDVEVVKNVKQLEKIPGVFVKDKLDDPCVDIRHTKRTIRTNIHVLHVEVKEGQTDAVIRFDSAKAAEEYCANSSGAAVLSGEEEAAQWERAVAAVGAQGRRARGRDVLRARAARPPHARPAPAQPTPTVTHIRFDE